LGFAQYIDLYDDKNVIAVDAHGIIHKDKYDLINELYLEVKDQNEIVVFDSKIIQEEDNYLILPMKMNEKCCSPPDMISAPCPQTFPDLAM